MKKLRRTLARLVQLVTNVHRIHHDRWSYGYTFRPLPWAYFPAFNHRDSDAPGGYRRIHYGWKRVTPKQFHDCTWTGVY
jgi:hypothetical protein